MYSLSILKLLEIALKWFWHVDIDIIFVQFWVCYDCIFLPCLLLLTLADQKHDRVHQTFTCHVYNKFVSALSHVFRCVRFHPLLERLWSVLKHQWLISCVVIWIQTFQKLWQKSFCWNAWMRRGGGRGSDMFSCSQVSILNSNAACVRDLFSL